MELVSFDVDEEYLDNCHSIYDVLSSVKCVETESLIKLISEFASSVIQICFDCSNKRIFPNDEDPKASREYEEYEPQDRTYLEFDFPFCKECETKYKKVMFCEKCAPARCCECCDEICLFEEDGILKETCCSNSYKILDSPGCCKRKTFCQTCLGNAVSPDAEPEDLMNLPKKCKECRQYDYSSDDYGFMAVGSDFDFVLF